MQKGIIYPKSRIHTKNYRQGESLEEFLRKAVAKNEPIEGSARVTFNDRKDGVLPQHDIRTDRFEMAIMATDKIHATQAAMRHASDFPETNTEQMKSILNQTKGEA